MAAHTDTSSSALRLLLGDFVRRPSTSPDRPAAQVRVESLIWALQRTATWDEFEHVILNWAADPILHEQRCHDGALGLR